MEAVIAKGAPAGLLVPQLQPESETLPLVGTGKVDDRGGAASKGRPAAGVKVVRRGSAAHIQVKMGMRVNKAGEQQAVFHIH